MLLDLAARRRVLFIGGKGGVGKTAIASAVGLQQARAGRRVLVVSTDAAHSLGHLWQRPVGDQPIALADRFDGVEIDPDRTTDEHLEAVGEQVRRLMPAHLSGEVDKHLRLSRDAPGMHEAAVLERITEVLQDAEHDLVIFDTAPSGHTARLLTLPETMSAWTEGLLRRQDRSARFGAALRNLDSDDSAPGIVGTGRKVDRRAQRDQEIRRILLRRRNRFTELRDLLTDSDRTEFVIVLAAERLPVLETIELYGKLLRSGVHVGALVVNKRSPADGGAFLAERRAQEAQHLEMLHQELGHVPMLELPLMSEDVIGEEGLQRLGMEIARAG